MYTLLRILIPFCITHFDISLMFFTVNFLRTTFVGFKSVIV